MWNVGVWISVAISCEATKGATGGTHAATDCLVVRDNSRSLCGELRIKMYRKCAVFGAESGLLFMVLFIIKVAF